MNRVISRVWGRSTSAASPRSDSNRSAISKAQWHNANSNRTRPKACSSIRVYLMSWLKGKLSPQKTTYLIVCCLIRALKSTNLSRSRLPQIVIKWYFRKTRCPNHLEATPVKSRLRIRKIRLKRKKLLQVLKRAKSQKTILEMVKKAS